MSYTNEAIFRYRLPIVGEAIVDMPERAEILSVGASRDDRDDLDVWARVNRSAHMARRRFFVVGTGHPIPAEAGRFVGTVPTHGGELIWHVFEGRAS